MANRMPELQRITRVLEIVGLIANQPGYWTRQKLADKYEISPRQISKDIELIRHGLRYEMALGQRAYAFTSVPRLPALSYSLPEALAIVLAAQTASQVPGVPRADLAAAIGRLIAIMPAELHPLLTSDTLFPSAASNPHREEVLETITQAIALRRSIEMSYTPAYRPAETTERRVDPYALLPNAPSWHLVGWCHLRQAVRIFKIDRMRDVRLSEHPYSPNPEFDLNEFLAAGWGITRHQGQPVEEVELLFSPTAGRWVAEEQWHPSQTSEWLADGRLRFRLRIPVTEEFARWVLRYGKDCRVVQPDGLRDWIANEARAIAAAYRATV